MTVNLALGRLKQGDQKFKASYSTVWPRSNSAPTPPYPPKNKTIGKNIPQGLKRWLKQFKALPAIPEDLDSVPSF